MTNFAVKYLLLNVIRRYFAIKGKNYYSYSALCPVYDLHRHPNTWLIFSITRINIFSDIAWISAWTCNKFPLKINILCPFYSFTQSGHWIILRNNLNAKSLNKKSPQSLLCTYYYCSAYYYIYCVSIIFILQIQ